jgi:hypothetical protein
MKHQILAIAICAIVIFSIACPLWGATGKITLGRNGDGTTDLDGYLHMVRMIDPQAVLTGWFWDWRSVSIYRSTAGYHLGYDIALDAGQPVPSGWPGRVVGVTPWTQNQYGISILTPSGYIVTYGHLSPRVSAGDWVETGDVVGTVVVDHVDVKIKDSDGNFVDFGKSCGLLPVDGSVRIRYAPDEFASIKPNSELTYRAKVQEISRLRHTIAILEDYLCIEIESYEENKTHLASLKKLLDEELISRNMLEEEKGRTRDDGVRVQNLKKRLASHKSRVASLQKEVALYAGRFDAPAVRKAAKKPVLPAKEKLEELSAKKVDEAKKKAELYEQLFKDGAISRKELEDARKNAKRLELEKLLNEAE